MDDSKLTVAANFEVVGFVGELPIFEAQPNTACS
jgi:hypothetical protein